MKNNQDTIKCPCCDWEYLPGEIYLPKHFLGQPLEITHTTDGKIDLYEGIEQKLNETFICNNCNKPFKIKATITYITIKDDSQFIFEEYETKKYKDRLILKEE